MPDQDEVVWVIDNYHKAIDRYHKDIDKLQAEIRIKRNAIACCRAAIDELLKGLTEGDKQNGL